MFGFALKKELSQTLFHHRIGVSLIDVVGEEFQELPQHLPRELLGLPWGLTIDVHQSASSSDSACSRGSKGPSHI